MIRTIALALALALPAAAAPVFVRTPMEVQTVYLDRHTAGRSSEMVLAREHLDVQIAGPIAKLTVSQLWRYDGNWQSPGDEASQTVRASHLSALHDYWITENGIRYPGLVRDLRSAKAAYQENLAQRRDPGLVEWSGEGEYHVRLYPVPNHGGTKDQGFTLVQALPVVNGEITLRWHLPVYAVERGTVSLRGVNGTRIDAASANFSFHGDETGIEGEYGNLAAGSKVLEIKLKTDDLQRRQNLSWYAESGTRFLQMSAGERFVACLAGNGYEGPTARFLNLERASADGVRVPDAWLSRLSASAQAVRLELDLNRHAEAMGALAGVKQVGPGVVLYADPAQTQEQIQQAWDAAVKTADCTPAAPAQPSFVSRLDFQMPNGFLVPNFKCARERANGRACFANQKTLIGALEMFCLDKNVKLGPEILGASSRPQAPTTTYVPPAGVEVSYWRGRTRRPVQSLAELVQGSEPWTDAKGPPQAVAFPAWLLKELKEGGYLQSIPQDPGFGPGTEQNYWLASTGNGIFCLNHGFIDQGGRIPARAQLEELGYNADVVASANPNMVHNSSYRRAPEFSGWLFLLGIMTGITAMLYLVIGLIVPEARSSTRVGECLIGCVKSLFWTVPAAVLGPFLLIPLFWAAVRLGQAIGAMAAAMASASHG